MSYWWRRLHKSYWIKFVVADGQEKDAAIISLQQSTENFNNRMDFSLWTLDILFFFYLIQNKSTAVHSSQGTRKGFSTESEYLQ